LGCCFGNGLQGLLGDQINSVKVRYFGLPKARTKNTSVISVPEKSEPNLEPNCLVSVKSVWFSVKSVRFLVFRAQAESGGFLACRCQVSGFPNDGSVGPVCVLGELKRHHYNSSSLKIRHWNLSNWKNVITILHLPQPHYFVHLPCTYTEDVQNGVVVLDGEL